MAAKWKGTETGGMTKVFLFGLEQAVVGQIGRAFDADIHQIEYQPRTTILSELLDADIIFAGGEPTCYMSLLRRVREARPTLPFIVVTRIPETVEWLDALEAGATDYCSMPIETRQLGWLIESALRRPSPRFAAA